MRTENNAASPPPLRRSADPNHGRSVADPNHGRSAADPNHGRSAADPNHGRSAAARAGLLAMHVLLAAAAFAEVSAVSTSALAEEPAAAEPAAAGVDLVLSDAPWTLDPEAVRAAVARELGGPVTLVPSATAGRPTLVLQGKSSGYVTLTYQAEDGHHIERTIDLPQEPKHAAQAISLLAGNLVRDEAAEIAAALGKRPPEAPAPSPAAPPPPRPPAPLPESKPPPRRPDKPAAAQPDPCAHDGARHVPFGADVVPYVGTSSVTGTDVVRRYSLNLLVGYTRGLSGFELSGGINIKSAFACGTQVASVANIVTGPVRGVQVTGGVNVGASLSGTQIGTVNIAAGPVTGTQLGIANIAAGPVTGTQLGIAANIAAGPVTGTQLGIANIATGPVKGPQVGIANITHGGTRGVQAGILNVTTGEVKGAQIGLINYADRSTLSLGLLSFIRNGRYHLDVWGLESGILSAGLKHGGDHFHNIYGVGVRVAGDQPVFTTTLGFGGHLDLSERLYGDLDVLAYTLHGPQKKMKPIAFMAQARVLLGLRLASGFAVFGGPSYNVAIPQDDDKDARLSPYGSFRFDPSSPTSPRGWPGVVLGVQAF